MAAAGEVSAFSTLVVLLEGAFSLSEAAAEAEVEASRLAKGVGSSSCPSSCPTFLCKLDASPSSRRCEIVLLDGILSSFRSAS